ncbi:MAG: hypothetical protein EP330_08695 [Deltaproteobacteria bacterium]|nr:MAG: hypothetical protein EP330_08695 [Deltaproteobacteria bacterium]
MTMLNSASDGHPVVWRSMVWTLASAADGTMPSSQLEALMAPRTVQLREEGKFFRTSLLRASELGVLEEQGASVGLSSGYASLQPGDVRAFRIRMRRAVLEPQNAEPLFGEGDQGGVSADLVRALAWFLAVDGLPGVGHNAVDRRLGETMLDGQLHTPQGQVRWNAFREWATLLGFVWEAGSGRVKAVVADPTVAIHDELADIFGDQTVVSQAEFRDSLARRLSVLDGGRYRIQMEASMKADAVERQHVRQFSASTARALRRLRAIGALRWDRRSDIDLAFFGAPGASGSESASHFIRGEALDA